MGKIKKEKLTKPLVDVKSKPSSPKKKKNLEKKNEDWNRKFGYIFPQSIKCMAESIGVLGISDELANNLSEDVSYRLRSVVQLCSKYLKHTRHKRLKCEDVNAVLEMCDFPPVIGHAAFNAPYEFTAIKDAGVVILEDPEVNLHTYALAEISVPRESSLTVTGKWMPAEEQTRIKMETEVNSESGSVNHVTNSLSKSEGANHKSEHVDNEPKIATNLIKYYGITCNTILGHSDLKVVYRDLSRSEKILPIVPYMLNFITITLSKLCSERQITRLLHTVESLTENTSIDFRPYHPVTRVANALLKIIKTVAVEKKRDTGLQSSTNQNDRSSQKIPFSYSPTIRIRAAEVLARVAMRWCCSAEQQNTLVQEMAKILQDMQSPPRVHIGALALLKELGPAALRSAFWNNLGTFLTYTQAARQDKSALELIIQEAAQVMYRNPHDDTTECPTVHQLDQMLYEYFGDAICPMWQHLLENPRFLQRHLEQPSASLERKSVETILKGTWRLPTCRNSMYNPEAKKPTINTAFQLPKFTRKRNPRIIFKFAGANPVPEMSLRRRRLDSRYSQFIAGKVSEGHVVLVGKFWQRPKAKLSSPPLRTASVFSVI